MVGLTNASRKYLTEDRDEDLDFEPPQIMENVSRHMMKINASQKFLDAKTKKLK